ncbi:perilipin-3-like isoform X1 [Hemicordylus capensis]|uniref:perilipin-3-like isoform X1 n=1 Tax=Hemicordylus capensis TaxID=884348 RepID=UPI002303D4D4|nr:perilipin-3-like isoform X1 [Hemicordylus capensis]XP_053145082.1 perilipin-3-like isoform X1 [Hemicordylus capensis]
MSSNEVRAKAEFLEGTEQDLQYVVHKVAALPLVSSAYEMVSATYTSAKESHPAIQAVCDVAETGVKTIATSAASSAQPLLSRLGPQIAAANVYACQGLDKLQETLPVLQQRVEKVVLDAKGLVSGAKDSVCTKVTEATDIASSMADVAKEAVQEGMGMARSAMTSGMSTVAESTVGQIVAGCLDKAIETSDQLLDHYLPMTDEELAALATSVDPEDSGVSPSGIQKQPHGYYVRLGSLSAKLRNRAYQHSLGKLQNVKQSTQVILPQLQQAIELIANTKKTVDQKVYEGQEKLQQMWLEWQQTQPGQSQTTKKNLAEMESEALSMSHKIALQMQAVCQSLLTNVQGLPAPLQEKVQQTYGNMEELQTTLSRAKTFQDVSTGILNESQERINKAREVVDEVVDYVMQNTPLTWVVGPFAPAGTLPVEPTELTVEAKVDVETQVDATVDV